MTAFPATRPMHVGFVPMPNFTMLALSGFLDTLRLAADDRDRSRPIDCRWTVMTNDGRSVRSSNGVWLRPDSAFVDPVQFDYLVVAGGIIEGDVSIEPALERYLHQAAASQVPLIGICTGSFVLARAGLMRGRKSCVSGFHRAEFRLLFPELEVVADKLFVIDRDRITCAGGTSVIHLASHLVEKHVGKGRAAKGLRVMLEDRPKTGSSPQPLPALSGLDGGRDPRVRRAILMIEKNLASRFTANAIAADLGVSPRQLSRLFVREVGQPPDSFRRELRMVRAREMISSTAFPLTEVAFRCGFADAAHLSRAFRKRYGETPSSVRVSL